MNREETIKYIAHKISHLYNDREARSIAKYYLIDTYGHNEDFSTNSTFECDVDHLAEGMPLQYVTHKAYFLDEVYYVDEHVLIPRPETEELVMLARQYAKSNRVSNAIDIGTGSGCIAISLASVCEEMTAIDVSSEALRVAQKNAKNHNAKVEFRLVDFLDRAKREELKGFDLVVSNPPYISDAERTAMHTNVLAYEPALALFGPTNDHLLFYRLIASWARHQNPYGHLFLEINEYHGAVIKYIFEDMEYRDVDIVIDLQGKDRVLRAAW